MKIVYFCSSPAKFFHSNTNLSTCIRIKRIEKQGEGLEAKGEGAQKGAYYHGGFE